MNSPASSPTGYAGANGPGAAIANFIEPLMQQRTANSWVPVALAVFCLLVITVVVTNTDEPFAFDE